MSRIKKGSCYDGYPKFQTDPYDPVSKTAVFIPANPTDKVSELIKKDTAN